MIFRDILQNTSSLRSCFRHPLRWPSSRGIHIGIQHNYENFFHCEQFLYLISYEDSFQVCSVSRWKPFPVIAIVRPTNDPSIDTFRLEYILGPAVVLSFIFNYAFTPVEVSSSLLVRILLIISHHRFCGRSLFIWRHWPSCPNCLCCKELEKLRPSQLIILLR